MSKTEEWILNWFREQNSEVPDGENDTEKLLGGNYFEMGWIDSLGILTLIDQVESEFGIIFTHEHFEQRRFSTIRGLAEIIDEQKNASAKPE